VLNLIQSWLRLRLRGINEIRLERQGGVEVEGCLCRGGDGWRERTAKVKRGGRAQRERRVRVYRVSVLKTKGTGGMQVHSSLLAEKIRHKSKVDWSLTLLTDLSVSKVFIKIFEDLFRQ